jgi:methyltransferase (TIGR00027 family)
LTNGAGRPLEAISDTAHWMAYYRAMESERPDALFRDPYARRLAGERGERAVRTMRRGKAAAWSTVVRTAVFDEIILERIERDGIGLVLNLAAGLDTRPYRLPLPQSLEWVEADLPPVIVHKSEVLAAEKPVCKLARVEVDLRQAEQRKRLLGQVSGRAQRALVITEGLLVYLDPDEVRQLAANLYEAEVFRFWLTDLASPKVVRILNRSWGRQIGAAGAAFRFAPAEGTGFFAPLGWRELEFRDFLGESRRLNRRMPADAWIRFWEIVTPKTAASWLREWRSGAVLLERCSRL